MCFRFSGAELRRNTNPHSMLINYFQGVRISTDSKADHWLSPALSKPGSAASAGDREVAIGPRHHRAEEQTEQQPLSPHTVVGGN